MGTWINDLKNNLVAADAAQTLPPRNRTASATGAAIDLQDAGGNCFAVLHVGTVAGTTPTLDVKLQEADTSGGTYGDIAGATFAQVTASDKYKIINFKRTKRFVRAIATLGGTSPNFETAVAIVGVKKSVA